MARIVFLFLFFTSWLAAQSNDSISNPKYLEDQLYFGLSYISLTKTPEGVSQNGFSNNLSLGFIKDIPVNIEGKFAFGLGLGYSRNIYYQNIKISELGTQNIFEIANRDDFDINKFSTHLVEIPIELRWRSSTAQKYKFWRLYAGAKVSYVFATNSKFKAPGNTFKVGQIEEINNLQGGLTLSVGYGTWNFNFYYGLTDIFTEANLSPDNIPIDIREYRIGLIFYIL